MSKINRRFPSIVLIIPALNEEEALGAVLKEVNRKLVKEMIVVDNGSTDDTARVAKENNAKVVFQPRRGYGSACLAGINYLEKDPPDIVVFMDGDYSDDPAQMEKLIQPLIEEGYDFVIGSRISGSREKGAMPFHSLLANKLFAKLVRVLYGLSLSDIGSYKAIKYHSLKSLGMIDPGYGFPIEMVVKSRKKGLKIKEVPVDFRKRIGKSKVTGNLFSSVNAGLKIFYVIFKYSIL